MSKRLLTGLLTLGILTSLPAHAASLAGTTCKKLGATTKSGSSNFKCVKSGKKLVWKAVAVAPATPVAPVTPVVPPIVTPTTPSGTSGAVTVKDPVAYPKTVTPIYSSTSSLTAPSGLRDPGSNNLRLFIVDPTSTSKVLNGSGIFYTGGGINWTYQAMNSDGTVLMNLPAATYQVDIVETNSNQERKRYVVEVPASGPAKIADLTANAQGYYAVTVDIKSVVPASVQAKRDALAALVNEPATSFKPSSPCQLIDQVTPKRNIGNLSAGFPKVPTRIKSYGSVRSLIVPVDFPDVQGKDDPVAYFSNVAKGVRDFFYTQSYGKVTFDFEIVPNWIRANFLSTKYGMGNTINTGDPNGYVKSIISMTDPAIDYSQYEAVYFLVPKEMPMANMGWGPAIASPFWTSTGYITNGAIGGADMYFNENNGIRGATWKWMAHETGHAFGLYDEDFQHQSSTLGSWSIMAMNWSNAAIELGAWDRYLQGWLPETQITCVTTSGSGTYKLEPLVRQARGMKSVMVPLSPSKILVIESRKSEGLDLLNSRQAGVLVYTVDMTIGQLGGGYRIVASPSMTDKQDFTDGTLKAGEQVSIDGVTVKVLSLSADGDQVQVTKN